MKTKILFSILLVGFLTMLITPTLAVSALMQVVDLDILNFNVLGLFNAFLPYIFLIIVMSVFVMMFPEARNFLGGLIGRSN